MNMFHFNEELYKNAFLNYEKFDRYIKKATFFHQNGTSSLIAPPNCLIYSNLIDLIDC